MKEPTIEIELNESGTGTVKIDGHDISNITRATTITTTAGQLSKVTLEIWAHHLKIKLPGSVVAEIREAMTPDAESENRVVERVLTVFDNRLSPSKLADEVLKIINARMGRMRP